MRHERKLTTRTPKPQHINRVVDGAEPPPREIEVETVLAGRREAVLVHKGVRYRLRVTSNDKLILTK